MSSLPEFEKMSVKELRLWPAKRIAESMPRVHRVRGEKDPEKKVLTIWVTWKEDTTAFQQVLPEKIQTALERWIWDGWTVEIAPELPWMIRRKPREGSAAPRPKLKNAAPGPRWDPPPGYFADPESERPKRRGG